MTAAYTSGPWEICCWTGVLGGAVGLHEAVWKGDLLICTTGLVTDPESRPNAQLIAAAPDLLEACKAFVKYDKNDATDGVAMMFAYSEMLKACRSAIAKATGVAV